MQEVDFLGLSSAGRYQTVPFPLLPSLSPFMHTHTFPAINKTVIVGGQMPFEHTATKTGGMFKRQEVWQQIPLNDDSM